jgi:hypothetical protein
VRATTQTRAAAIRAACQHDEGELHPRIAPRRNRRRGQPVCNRLEQFDSCVGNIMDAAAGIPSGGSAEESKSHDSEFRRVVRSNPVPSSPRLRRRR